jgi:hypothetical protein
MPITSSLALKSSAASYSSLSWLYFISSSRICLCSLGCERFPDSLVTSRKLSPGELRSQSINVTFRYSTCLERPMFRVNTVPERALRIPQTFASRADAKLADDTTTKQSAAATNRAIGWLLRHITMRLSDTGHRQPKTKLIYPHHRLPPWFNEDAAPRSLEPIVRRLYGRRIVRVRRRHCARSPLRRFQ